MKPAGQRLSECDTIYTTGRGAAYHVYYDAKENTACLLRKSLACIPINMLRRVGRERVSRLVVAEFVRCPDEAFQLCRDPMHVDCQRYAAIADHPESQLLYVLTRVHDDPREPSTL